MATFPEEKAAGEFNCTKQPNTENTRKADLIENHTRTSGRVMGRKRKRTRAGTFSQDDLADFQNSTHSLRINVSELAACAGFHPFKSLPKLLMEHIYQGRRGQALLQHDAKLLNLQLVDEEAALRELAQKAGDATQKALKKALEIKKGTVKSRLFHGREKLKTILKDRNYEN